MPTNQLAYLELPCTDVSALKKFYGSLFAWNFQDWGDDYAAFSQAGLDGGFNADASKSKAPLAIIQTTEIEAMQERIGAAGGVVTVPVFAFPGGRRFHFTDPAGNELAVMQVE